MTRVLVVEDEPDIALGLEHDLRRDGYDVEILDDGQRAVERVGVSTFDLILLDVMLRGKDGFSVCRELRRSGTHTPIILLTTVTVQLQPGDRLLLFSDGVSDAVNEGSVEFGSARVAEMLLNCRGEAATDMRDAMLTELRAYTAGCAQFDDLTLIAGIVR